MNSKTQRPISFGYLVQGIDGTEIGVISIPIQQRPSFLLRDFGRLKKDTVYLRRGSSTDIADPDEIVKIGASTSQVEPPGLTVTARVLNAYKGEFIVAIANANGAGLARAPYLELEPPAPFFVASWGLDGNHNQGLPLLPQGSGAQRLQFAGTNDIVLHPGTVRDVTRVEWRGPQGQVPAAIELPYVVGADVGNVIRGKISIVFHR